MLRLTPILLAVIYGLVMYRISVWRTHRELDRQSTELADPKLKALTDEFDISSPYAPEAYDAAALFMFAMQKANSTDPAEYGQYIMDMANAPGEKIYPGEIAKGLEIIKNGGDIDYVGGSAVELIGPGESAGTYREIEVQDGANVTVRMR